MVCLSERLDPADDSLTAWTEHYLDLAVYGVRPAEVTAKVDLQDGTSQTSVLVRARSSIGAAAVAAVSRSVCHAESK